MLSSAVEWVCGARLRELEREIHNIWQNRDASQRLQAMRRRKDQLAAVCNYLLNELDAENGETIVGAGDNVILLRHLLRKAGEPDPPVASQKMWRPVASGTSQSVQAASPLRRTTSKPKRQSRGRTVIKELEDDDDTDPRYCIQLRHIWRMEPCNCSGE